MYSPELVFRQIHLDFHTSEHIAGIGDQFDPDVFADTLARAHVNSVTCFARCHHGWMYFDTQAFPERRHPHLSRNLLLEQIRACHARGIRVPIYVTVQWDHYTANLHPEWLVVDEHGCPRGTPLYEAGFYRSLCVNSPYVDFLKAHVREILETLPVDGFFFDIVQPQDCSCRFCRAEMTARGLDPSRADVRQAFGLEVLHRFKRDMTAFVRQFNAEATIFYNAGHIGPRHRAVADAYTHWELESLPSGGWGYMHFPLTMRYARTLGLDCLGMTGKFHTSWGDFSSFKNLPALQYECFNMLALNAKCSIGDQLPPSGQICPHVYDLIGQVYGEVERKEPWCRAARPVVEIGVLTPAEWSDEHIPAAAAGAVAMLEQSGHQFDILDTAGLARPDLASAYRIIILPDEIPVGPEAAQHLKRYLAQGGALIASYHAGLNAEGTAFALEALGVERVGEAPYSPDFILPAGPIGAGLPPTEHVMYRRGLQVQAQPGSQVLAQTVLPFFNRTYEHFCSHRHTPSSGQVGYPGIVQNGRCIYFMHPVFTQYNQNAPRWCKQLLLNALDLLLPNPLIRHNGPATLRVTVNDQPGEHRRIVHLLHYIPERRSQDMDVIEDVLPLYQIELSVRVPGQVSGAVCVPQNEPLTFTQEQDRVTLILPKLTGHQMIDLELKS